MNQAADTMEYPALALLEVRSIARGMAVVDAMVKKATVVVQSAHTISPGHFIILLAGPVAEIEESLLEGLARAGDTVLDHVFLPYVHPFVPNAIAGKFGVAENDSVAIIETFTVAGTIRGADAACKAADVRIIAIRLGQGIGGKAVVVLAGQLFDIEAAVVAVKDVVQRSLLTEIEIVPRPHPDFLTIFAH
ncbi:MAG: BMC domain-containing protein [Myxococcales bacterium]|nr:BMC domain-containing protein [Myxococcales bacterium]